MKLSQKIIAMILVFFASQQSKIVASYSHFICVSQEGQPQNGSCLRPTDDGEECGGLCAWCYNRSKLQATEDSEKNSLLFKIMSEHGLVDSSGKFCGARSSSSAPSILMTAPQTTKNLDRSLSIKKNPLKKAKSVDALREKKQKNFLDSDSKNQEIKTKKPRLTVGLLAAQVTELTGALTKTQKELAKTQKENSDLHARLSELEYRIFGQHRG